MSESFECKLLTDIQLTIVSLGASIEFFLAELYYKKQEVGYCEDQLVKLYTRLKQLEKEKEQ